jgi:hypothetical protein
MEPLDRYNAWPNRHGPAPVAPAFRPVVPSFIGQQLRRRNDLPPKRKWAGII